jgi:pimeloyl-ACP methyl ester carboxylesterase
LLFDLLTSEEGEVDIRTRELRFDIALLARRSIGVLDWLAQQGFANNLKTGLFGASTGAAAALIAAAERPEHVNAVVSRGGRPDLALDYLHRVETPTLLLVGSNDEPVIGMNQEAMNAMDSNTVSELRIIPGAGHLFEEPGALEEVAQYAGEWFIRYLPGSGAE